MEKVSDRVIRFLAIGYGDGSGYGSGYGDGYGSGYGDGSGDGDGYGSGDGYGYGSGYGDGSGDGDGYGSGDGYGYGYGDGYGDGSGYGDGCAACCGERVYMVDGIQTVFHAVHGNVAHGAILCGDLTLKPCYVARVGDHFAHGATLAEAVQAARDKAFKAMPEEDRIAAFWECHEPGVKYPAADLYDWHHRLTGSCEMGRRSFAADHGIDLERDTYTVEEFVEICADSYGGDIIRKIMEKRRREK